MESLIKTITTAYKTWLAKGNDSSRSDTQFSDKYN
jgi:hypothetical protein